MFFFASSSAQFLTKNSIAQAMVETMAKISRCHSVKIDRGPTKLVQNFAYRGFHIGARALLVILFDIVLWFGYITRLSQSGGEGGILLIQKISTFYVASRRLVDSVIRSWECTVEENV
jgi:hypothetical protein